MWKMLKKILSGESGEEASKNASKDTSLKNSIATGSPVPLVQPPTPRKTDLNACYDVLGLEPGTGLNHIRRAWKQKLKEVHMGHYADDMETKQRARERTQQLNEAYRALQQKLS